jgi:hypothetical protein
MECLEPLFARAVTSLMRADVDVDVIRDLTLWRIRGRSSLTAHDSSLYDVDLLITIKIFSGPQKSKDRYKSMRFITF